MNEFWVGMGCFWGAEKLFWETPGVTDTQVGYAGGRTSNPSYRAVCSGSTGHAEVVRVRFDPQVTSLEDLVVLALENHDPTQGNRQGADIGTQYRSVFFLPTSDDAATVERILDAYGKQLAQQGYGPITTQVVLMDQAGTGFWSAEDYHQRYLEKNPGGYCPHHGTGVCYVR
ncbi:peptide-methionine (S)-S-oxide reductase MsrA [Corynebacterium argentoratense]|nr:peptide-methionine (S)-S-oxide reductase MsrA [Corynebacterium argentoratense]